MVAWAVLEEAGRMEICILYSLIRWLVCVDEGLLEVIWKDIRIC